MITHRFATADPTPPVRTYKWIALSFLLITGALFVVIIFMLTKKTTITVVAKEDIKSVSVTVRVAKNRSGDDIIMGTVRTVPFAYAAIFHPTGTKTVSGVAGGRVILYNKTDTPQPLIKNTRLLSPDGVLFRLTDRVTVPAKGEAMATVYADQPGAESDIKPTSFTIPGLSADKQKVIYADSKEMMQGGVSRVGAVTDTDLKNAETEYRDQAAAAFLRSVSGTLPTATQHLVAVDVANIVADHKSGEEVGEFTLSGTSTVVIVAYNEKDLQELLAEAVAGKVNAESEKVLSLDKEPRVALTAYNVENGTAELSVTQNVVVTLDANGSALAGRNFLGKKKGEIERYLMGLDHVYAVDVSFSPSWVSTAPSVADRIKVVVKSVK